MCSRSQAVPKTELVSAAAPSPPTEDIASLQIAQVDDKFNTPPHLQNVIVRHVVMQWENSLGGLANYPENAEWRPLEGHYDIFQSTTRYKQGAVKRSKFRQGDLEQSILIGMKVRSLPTLSPSLFTNDPVPPAFHRSRRSSPTSPANSASRSRAPRATTTPATVNGSLT